MSDNKGYFQESSFKVAKLFRLFSGLLQEVFSNSGFQFTNEQLWILIMLWEEEGVSQQRIGTGLMRDKATISHLINVLEKKEIVYRKSDPKDERQKLIFLTEKGAAIKAEVSPRLNSAFEEVSSLLDKKQMKDLNLSLASLIQGFD